MPLPCFAREQGSRSRALLRADCEGRRGFRPAETSEWTAETCLPRKPGKRLSALVSRHSRFAMQNQRGLKAGVDPELHDRGRLPHTQRGAGAARADVGATTAAPSRLFRHWRRCRSALPQPLPEQQSRWRTSRHRRVVLSKPDSVVLADTTARSAPSAACPRSFAPCAVYDRSDKLITCTNPVS